MLELQLKSIIVEKIKPGAFTKMLFMKEYKLPKKFNGDRLVKYCEGVFRYGINYYNIKENINKNVQGLPWGENVKNYEKYLITYNNNLYLKVYTTQHKTKSIYFLNGKEISKQELIDKGYITKNNPTTTFTININNILDIGFKESYF